MASIVVFFPPFLSIKTVCNHFWRIIAFLLNTKDACLLALLIQSCYQMGILISLFKRTLSTVFTALDISELRGLEMTPFSCLGRH